MDTGDISSKHCHSCRRRRLRCDRLLPHCKKCLKTGRECLGYGTLLRWTGAVASHGKLAGRTSSAPTSSPRNCIDKQQYTSSQAYHAAPSIQDGNIRDRAGEDTPLVLPGDDRDGHTLTTWVLTDPFWQDLDRSYRLYLFYFDQRVCRDLVSRDIPEGNPFRNLLPLAGAHPLLQHTIVATSAIHMSRLLRAPLCRPGDEIGGLAALGSDERYQRAYRHAVAAKHKALGIMRDAIGNIHIADCDAVVTSVFFLVNLELIESGRIGWKAHLKGAGRIISLLQPTLAKMGPLAEYISSDYLIYTIMASVFMASPVFDTNAFFRPTPFAKMLERAAAYSHICCPPEILNVLLAAATLSNRPDDASDYEQTIAAASKLFQDAHTFDVDAWARDEENFSLLRSATVQTRIHAGHAHRLAACLYILRAIPAMNSLQGSNMIAKSLISSAFQHISSIPDDDPNLKVITWPTFVVGADSDEVARREWAMGRLRQLATYWPWGFLYNAMDTLQKLWCLDHDESSGRSWVHALKESDSDFLIV